MSILCSMVGATFSVAAAAEVIRRKYGLTANGNAQIDTAQSQFGGSSALFDGTGDFLTVDNLASNVTDDYTFECWVRFNALPSSGAFMMLATGDGNRYFGLLNNSGTQRWESSVMTGSNQYVARYTPTITTGVWYHIALVKSGSTLTLYHNGTSQTATTIAGTMTSTSTLFTSSTNILGAYTSSNHSLNGWMDEIRISKSARYTTNFTPSTTPFVNDDNTVLLIHANGTDATTFFEDDNGIRASTGLVGTGSAAISTAQSRFGGSSLRTVAANETKISFENAPLNAIGTGDFTIEFFTRLDAVNQTTKVFLFTNEGNAGRRGIQLNNQTVLYTISGSTVITTANVLSANTWHHIALVRVGTTTRLYVDGVDRGNTVGDSSSLASTGNNTIANLATGFTPTGYIDEFRMSKVARYTAAFTAPTAPFVNDSDTTLLIHFDGTDASTVFRDDNGQGRAQNGIRTNGNAQISTAQSQFGGASALFDGTGDFLTIPNNSAFNFGSNAFTIEGWVRATNFTNFPSIMGMATIGSNDGWTLQFTSGGLLYFECGVNGGNADLPINTSAFSANTWTHFAFVRSGNTLYAFRNGTLDSSVSFTGSINSSTANLIIGDGYGISSGLWAASQDFNGYLDEIRISNTARYTAGFTPSTTPFQNDSNTLLLLHMDGTNASTVFVDDNGRHTTPT